MNRAFYRQIYFLYKQSTLKGGYYNLGNHTTNCFAITHAINEKEPLSVEFQNKSEIDFKINQFKRME